MVVDMHPQMKSTIYIVADVSMRAMDRYKVGVHDGTYEELCRRYNTSHSDVHLYFAAMGTLALERKIHTSLQAFRLPRGDMHGRSEVVVMPLPELIRRVKAFVIPAYVRHVGKTKAREDRKFLEGDEAHRAVRLWVEKYQIRKLLPTCELQEETELVFIYHKFDGCMRLQGVFVGLNEFVRQMVRERCELTHAPNDTRKYFIVKTIGKVPNP
jgi:hypothetical protein